MPRSRDPLPQLKGAPFLTDGGIETTLIYLEGLELPYFAAFHLLSTEEGERALRAYFERYATLAREHGVGCVLESATWRASADWGAKLGYDADALARLNRRAIEMLHEIRAAFENATSPMVVSGCVGPRGDGYRPDAFMSADDAERYHRPQIQAFRDADADQVTAITMTYPEEAIGVARAAGTSGLPVALSFTVETDGRLPNGESLGEAIERTDAATGGEVAYYMINCAHPTHFEAVLDPDAAWTARIRGLRANASTKSHAELDVATELDAGDPSDLARRYRDLRERLPGLAVLGGCCGTDDRHIGAIAEACLRPV
jgi:homocysteine S-methyltransferase